jgi:hypothetical protein
MAEAFVKGDVASVFGQFGHAQFVQAGTNAQCAPHGDVKAQAQGRRPFGDVVLLV